MGGDELLKIQQQRERRALSLSVPEKNAWLGHPKMGRQRQREREREERERSYKPLSSDGCVCGGGSVYVFYDET